MERPGLSILKIILILFVMLILSGCTPEKVRPTFTMDKDFLSSKNQWHIAVVDLQYEYEDRGTFGTTEWASAGKDGGRVVAGILSAELASIKKFRTVERNTIDTILAEQQLQLSGVVDDQVAVKVGKLAGAEAVVVGELIDYVYWRDSSEDGSTVSFSIRLIDVEQGRVLMSTAISRARPAFPPVSKAFFHL